MKKDFFDYLDKLMEQNEDIYFLYGDLGYPRVSEFKKKYPDRVFNCGASEQSMMDIAVGLAYAGKIPITYTITPFYLRAYETLRTYITKEKLNITMIGVGVDDDYSIHDGYSHDAKDMYQFMKYIVGVYNWRPANINTLEEVILHDIEAFDGPKFINIKR